MRFWSLFDFFVSVDMETGQHRREIGQEGVWMKNMSAATLSHLCDYWQRLDRNFVDWKRRELRHFPIQGDRWLHLYCTFLKSSYQTAPLELVGFQSDTTVRFPLAHSQLHRQGNVLSQSLWVDCWMSLQYMCWFHAASLSLSAWRASFCRTHYRQVKFVSGFEFWRCSVRKYCSHDVNFCPRYKHHLPVNSDHRLFANARTWSISLLAQVLSSLSIQLYAGHAACAIREWKMNLGGTAPDVFLIMLFFCCHVE